MTPARGWAYLAGFVAFFAVPFAVHLLRVRRGDVTLPPPRRAGAGARLFGPLFVSYGYWLLRPLFRAAERTGVTPNQVTLLSLVVAVGGALAIATGRFALASALVVGGAPWTWSTATSPAPRTWPPRRARSWIRPSTGAAR